MGDGANVMRGRVFLSGGTALVLVLAACGGGEAPVEVQTCPVSSPVPVTEDVAPGLGENPVWIITTPVLEEWEPASKTGIVVYGDFQEVEITGNQLNGEGAAAFANFDDSVRLPNKVTRLVLKQGESEVTPGNRQAGPEYHYYVGYFLYPSPGCWEFTAKVGAQTAQIVQYVGSPGTTP